MICEYCKSTFANLISLNTHKKRAKYCLKIQNNIGIINNLNFTCGVCFKNFSDKRSLNNHLNKICMINDNHLLINDKLNELHKTLKILKDENIELNKDNYSLKNTNEIFKKDHDCVLEIAKQPKNITTNMNKILNIAPLNLSDTENIKSLIDSNYNIDYIFSGQKGFAKFAVDHLLKDDEGNLKYVCTDPSRQIFKYKDISGEVRKDIEAKKLTSYLVDGGIKDKACNMAIEWWKDDNGEVNTSKFELLIDKAESMRTIDEDNNEFKKELVNMISV